MIQMMTKTTTYTYQEMYMVDIQEWADRYEAYIYRDGFPVKRLAFTTGKDQFSREEFMYILEYHLLDDEIERYEAEIVEPTMKQIDYTVDSLIANHIHSLNSTPFVAGMIEDASENDLSVYDTFEGLKGALVESAAESGYTLPEYFKVFYGEDANNWIAYDDSNNRYIVTKFC